MASNKEIIYNYLKGKGLNDKAIAGVMGNIQLESNFNTAATNKGSGAYGLFQWLGGRKEALKNFAKENGTSAGNIYTQLDFFWYELNNSESKSKDVLFNSNYGSASQYAEAFEKSFERSGGAGNSKRKEYAEDILTEISSGDFKTFNVDTTNNPVYNLDTGDTDMGFFEGIAKTVVKILFMSVLVILGVLFLSQAFRG